MYEKGGFQLTIKDIKNGYTLIENKEFNTIEKIKQKILQEEIPIYTDNYFIKKAEIELDKILKR